jgi:small conductance mechanosensitive channel
MEPVNQWLAHEGLTILFIIIGSALMFYFGEKAVAFFVEKAVEGKGRGKGEHRKDVEKRADTLSSLVSAIWRFAVIAVAAISILRVLFPGLDFSPLFASAGVIGIAIAFGSQTIVKDFLTGVFIVSENQYRVGDVVEINGAEGRVEQLGTRTTVIRDFDGNVHYLPNSSIIHVVNKTMGYSRVNFSLSIALTNDLNEVISIINQVGDTMADDKQWKKQIIEAPQFESIGTFSASAVDIAIKGKVQPSDQWRVTAEMRRRLLEEFEKAKIELA